jgi:hypothetical protein
VIHDNPANWTVFDAQAEVIALGGTYPIKIINPPANRDSELVLLHFYFRPTGAAGNRYVVLSVKLAATYQTLALTTTPMMATNVWEVTFGQGLDHAVVAAHYWQTAPLVERLRIPPNQVSSWRRV